MSKSGLASAWALLGVMVLQASLGRLLPTLYRDPAWAEATWIGNDWITLGFAVPLLGGALFRARFSAKARLIVLGVAAYALYNYTFYVFGARLNPFFPLYLCGIWLSGICLVSEIRMRPAAVEMQRRRLIAGYLMAVAVTLSTVWFILWGLYVFAGQSTLPEPEAFKIVAATDLLLLVPPLLAGGALLWKNAPLGHTIATVAAIEGALYLLVLSVNSAVAINMGFSPAPGELPIWLPLVLVTTAAAVALLRTIPVVR